MPGINRISYDLHKRNDDEGLQETFGNKKMEGHFWRRGNGRTTVKLRVTSIVEG